MTYKYSTIWNMRVLIAPNAFKGTLSAETAADIVAREFGKFSNASVVISPIADGGDGLSDVFLFYKGGKKVIVPSLNSFGEKIKSSFVFTKDGVAVIETAKSCGLGLIKGRILKPTSATSYGAGLLIKSALDKGAKNIFVGLGGSAAHDAGAGLANALGIKFLDKDGTELPRGGASLLCLDRIDVSGRDKRLNKVKITALSDVDNPIIGRNGSSAIYARQKGANSAQIKIFERAFKNLCRVVKRDLGKDITQIPCLGAAGGICAGLYAFLNAEVRPGADFVFNLAAIEDKIKKCSFAVTGEGKFDRQSFYGKATGEFIKLCAKHSKPVIVITGINEVSKTQLKKTHSNIKVFCAEALGISPKIAVAKPKQTLAKIAKKAADDFCAQTEIGGVSF